MRKGKKDIEKKLYVRSIIVKSENIGLRISYCNILHKL